ncbi:MAG: RNA methyltransferase [Planctomycetota bacterium]|jgi:TrmH family RNA methyltransferase|nr:RNA methyltransferase [Planctomycetota bacterium]MDP7129388.1 RNA methyltransferase [Planctomycetota bacterium]MDP7251652.1 RNA methyltransferase [Planctomycetota bacterium]
MTYLRISSRQNKRIKQFRRAGDHRLPGTIFIEGTKLTEEALRCGLQGRSFVVSDSFLKKGDTEILGGLEAAGVEGVQVPDWLMEELSVVKTPPGLIVLADRSESDSGSLPAESTFIVIAHQVQDPGNLGTILRSAEAAGAHAVIVTRHGADPFSPKGLRGSMGATLRLPIWHGPTLSQSIAACHERGIQVYAASPKSQTSLWDHDWSAPSALLLGSEGSGLSVAELKLADGEITIPMAGRCESLNVGAAATALMFEVARQRSASAGEG